jgi:uncharacterized protein
MIAFGPRFHAPRGISPMTAQFRILASLKDIAPHSWNALVGDNPFLHHEFLHALHESGAACPETGWAPSYVTLWDGATLTGAMPLYLKSHSFGEYIFDWSWADAYHRYGHRYYPKLLCAVPFTPVPGPRLLAADAGIRAKLASKALQLVDELSASSLHCLFADDQDAGELGDSGMMLRESVRFIWRNPGYADFEQFLAAMSHDKRKKIKQERRKLKELGVTFRWLDGNEIGEADWRFFTRCYVSTYRAHQSTPYLNLDFFLRIARSMPQYLLMQIATLDTRPVGATLFFRSGERLYGRHWGSTLYVSGLHFEACYYQPIAFCIEKGLRIFEGGVQGEHKLARGLLPVKTYSAHLLADASFSTAVKDFLKREAKGVGRYIEELRENSPFKLRMAHDAGEEPTQG